MTDSQVLVSTRATMPTAAGASLDVEFRKAQALAKAGNLLPSAYRNNPGAIILIQQWANARGIDTVTAIQTVSFIDGRPVVDATMQRAMAEREGVRVKVVSADREKATVEIHRGDELMGSVTYTMDDARDAGLDRKQNWQKNPVDMLVARATTRGIRWHAPSVMLGTFTEDEAEQFDTTAALAPQVDDTPAVEAAEPEIVDAEIVETPAVVEPEQPTAPLTVAELRDLAKLAGKTQREVIEMAQEVAIVAQVDKPGSLAAILESAIAQEIITTLSVAANEATANDPFGGES
jgi:hypothetical protein